MSKSVHRKIYDYAAVRFSSETAKLLLNHQRKFPHSPRTTIMMIAYLKSISKRDTEEYIKLKRNTIVTRRYIKNVVMIRSPPRI